MRNTLSSKIFFLQNACAWPTLWSSALCWATQVLKSLDVEPWRPVAFLRPRHRRPHCLVLPGWTGLSPHQTYSPCPSHKKLMQGILGELSTGMITMYDGFGTLGALLWTKLEKKNNFKKNEASCDRIILARAKAQVAWPSSSTRGVLPVSQDWHKTWKPSIKAGIPTWKCFYPPLSSVCK